MFNFHFETTCDYVIIWIVCENFLFSELKLKLHGFFKVKISFVSFEFRKRSRAFSRMQFIKNIFQSPLDQVEGMELAFLLLKRVSHRSFFFEICEVYQNNSERIHEDTKRCYQKEILQKLKTYHRCALEKELDISRISSHKLIAIVSKQ